ncbi:MAG: RibD family protein, partial [Vicinamibacteraceae bacterium]
ALKLALTLDAKLSRAPGERTQITGPAAQRAVHRQRAGFDAILVGIGTVLADDPLLTVRTAPAPRVAPRRIVLDTEARLPLDARLTSSAASGPPVWVFTSGSADTTRTQALEARGVRVLRVPATAGTLDLRAVLDTLAEEGVQDVLCEGGGQVAASLLAADLVERMHLFYAPLIFGTGVDAFPFGRPATFGDRWRPCRTRRYGRDVLLTLDRARMASLH